jgi:hypothetical protein
MTKEILGELMPLIIIVVFSFAYIIIKNKLRGKKWNYIDPDTSDKM